MTSAVVIFVLCALVAQISAQTTTVAVTTAAGTTAADTTAAAGGTTAAAGATTTAATNQATTAADGAGTTAAPGPAGDNQNTASDLANYVSTNSKTCVAETQSVLIPPPTSCGTAKCTDAQVCVFDSADSKTSCITPDPICMASYESTTANKPGAGTPVATPTGTAGCQDVHQWCCFWAGVGQCESNAYWMKPNCQKACGTCGCTVETVATCKGSTLNNGCPATAGGNPAPSPTVPNTGDTALCGFWASAGECTKNAAYMTIYCKAACAVAVAPALPANIPRIPYNPLNAAKMPDFGAMLEQKMPDFGAMLEQKMPNFGAMPEPTPVVNAVSCSDSDPQCPQWAAQGDCDTNMFWMKPNCQKSCGTCGCTRCCKRWNQCCAMQTGAGQQTGTPNLTNSENSTACDDLNASCAFWASIKECTKNPSWMDTNCRKACNKC